MENFIGWTDANAQSIRDAICVAICDDEAFMLELLEEKIKNMLPSAVIEQFSSGHTDARDGWYGDGKAFSQAAEGYTHHIYYSGSGICLSGI